MTFPTPQNIALYFSETYCAFAILNNCSPCLFCQIFCQMNAIIQPHVDGARRLCNRVHSSKTEALQTSACVFQLLSARLSLDKPRFFLKKITLSALLEVEVGKNRQQHVYDLNVDFYSQGAVVLTSVDLIFNRLAVQHQNHIRSQQPVDIHHITADESLIQFLPRSFWYTGPKSIWTLQIFIIQKDSTSTLVKSTQF